MVSKKKRFGEDEIAPTLTAISNAVMNGELDALLAVTSAFGHKGGKGRAEP